MNEIPELSPEEAAEGRRGRLEHFKRDIDRAAHNYVSGGGTTDPEHVRRFVKEVAIMSVDAASCAEAPVPYVKKIRAYLDEHLDQVDQETLVRVMALLHQVQEGQEKVWSHAGDYSGDVGTVCDLLGIDQHEI